MKKPLLLAAAGAVCVLAACGTTPPAQPPPSPTAPASVEATQPGPATAPHCGIERWPVKTGTDQDAAKVDLNAVVPATIQALGAITPPQVLPQNNRAATTDANGHVIEETVYQVQATLKEYKLEADSDYHLVLADGQGHTMIAEIPSPACAGPGSPFLPGITRARKQFDAVYAPGDFWQPSGVAVVVTGVGFFDRLHGQTGVAPNGAELHPVTDIQVGQAP